MVIASFFLVHLKMNKCDWCDYIYKNQSDMKKHGFDSKLWSKEQNCIKTEICEEKTLDKHFYAFGTTI